MISAAREALWSSTAPKPVHFTVGRKYVRCSDAVLTLPGTATVTNVSPTTLTVNAPNNDLAAWVNHGLHAIDKTCQKRGMHVMPFSSPSGELRLAGPWNVMNARLMASPHALQVGDQVRLRVSPVVTLLAPNEFRVALQAVDVARVTNAHGGT